MSGSPEAPDTSTRYVAFVGPINANTAAALTTKLDELANGGAEEVVLGLWTEGGMIEAGYKLYEELRQSPLRITTHNLGLVASLGVVVFLAGDERSVGPESVFLLHPASFTAEAGKVFDVKLLRERIALLEASDHREQLILEERTPLTSVQIKALVESTTTLDAQQSVAAGLADEIKRYEVPPGEELIRLP